MPPVTDLQTMIDQTQEKLSEEATTYAVESPQWV